MDNSETLTTLDTQETGRTMIDITLHRKHHYNPDYSSNDTKEKRVLAQLVVPTSFAKRIIITAKGNNQKKTDKAKPRNTINGSKD